MNLYLYIEQFKEFLKTYDIIILITLIIFLIIAISIILVIFYIETQKINHLLKQEPAEKSKPFPEIEEEEV